MKYDCNNNIQKSIISTKIKLNLLKVSSKKKNFELSNKTSYLGIFLAGIWKKTIAIFEISTLKFFDRRSFMGK